MRSKQGLKILSKINWPMTVRVGGRRLPRQQNLKMHDDRMTSLVIVIGFLTFRGYARINSLVPVLQKQRHIVRLDCTEGQSMLFDMSYNNGL